MLARDIRACPPGHAQYTTGSTTAASSSRTASSCARAGRLPADRAEPNLACFADRIGRAGRPSRRSAPTSARSPSRARARGDLLARLVPQMERHPLLRPGHRQDRRRGGDGEPDRLQRRPRLRDLGRRARRDARLGHAVGERRRATGSSRSAWLRCRCCASRPACSSSKPTSTRAGSPGTTPTAPRRSSSAGAGCSGASRPTTGRSSAAARWSVRSPTRRRAGRGRGSWSTGRSTSGSTTRPGSSRPRTTRRSSGGVDVLRRRHHDQVGYATSFMYSPMLQRHIAIARVRPDLAKRHEGEPGVHRRPPVRAGAAHVARLPLYNPERKTA